MTTAIQVRRRATNGAAGAPSTLLSGEIAYNMADGYLYIGYGDAGDGTATSIKPFAHDGFNTATLVPAGGLAGYVLTKSSSSDYAFTWQAISQGTSYSAGTGISITGSSIAIDPAVTAKLASPALTGTPTAPTAAAGTNTTQLATTGFVATAITNLVNAAPAALDTLGEIAAQLASDESAASALTTTVAGKLGAGKNLSDLTDTSAARTSLGLGSLALQGAGSIAVTGGTISGVTLTSSKIDGGTF